MGNMLNGFQLYCVIIIHDMGVLCVHILVCVFNMPCAMHVFVCGRVVLKCIHVIVNKIASRTDILIALRIEPYHATIPQSYEYIGVLNAKPNRNYQNEAAATATNVLV